MTPQRPGTKLESSLTLGTWSVGTILDHLAYLSE